MHLTGRSDTGGLFRYVSQLCDALHRQGHHPAVAGQLYETRELFANKPWPWVEIPCRGGVVAMVRALQVLQRWVDDHPVDLLHVHFRKPMFMARRVAARQRPRLPILYTLHLSGIPIHGMWRWLSDFGDHAHVASVDARDWLIEAAGVQSDKITIIPHGIDPSAFPMTTPTLRAAAREQLQINTDGPVALYVGRLEDPKNENWLLDLAATRKVPGLQIMLAGTGPNEPAVRERISREGLQDTVKLFPFASPLPYYQAADALLLPSQIEGFSLVTIEAMSTGLPVLRTRTAGTTETIVEGVTGRSTDIEHDAFLHEALSMISNMTEMKRMGTQAQRMCGHT
ncbi:MAG: glycosyltransferase family 4 protein [Phycisphaerales bacterium]|nr:glycosyltransferase family 4 protein [Phycisphaerales bacterium]